MDRWQRAARTAFLRRVKGTPARVLRDRILREYFLVDFFHDAVIRRIAFDHRARELTLELITSMRIVARYSTEWGIRLPRYEFEGSPRYYVWRCTFFDVTHFTLNAVLTRLELMNGKVVPWNKAFLPYARRLEYLEGRFLSSRLAKQHEVRFKRKLLHLRIDCDTRILNVIFSKLRLRRVERAPHKWREKKEFNRFLRTSEMRQAR